MSILISLLETESRERGLLARRRTSDGGAGISRWCGICRTAGPVRHAGPRRLWRSGRGTCSGKHYLLADIFRELGLEARVIMCTHRFTADNTRHFPAELRALVAEGPVPDVHTYLRVKTAAGWAVVDATWPGSAGPLGMPVNREFTPDSDMTIACDPIETLPVPDGQDPQEFKEQVIREFCGAGSAVRDQFIEGMGRWLGEST